MTTAALFVMLFVFMLLGMPIAMSLGLSSLLTILLFAQDSLASLSLKLYETSEQFTLLAIPFFILAGTFMTTGGVARADDPLRQRLPRPLSRRPGDGLGAGVHAVRRGLGLVAGDGGGGRLDRHRRHGAGRLPAELRRRRHLQRRHAGHPDPAVDRDGRVRRGDRDLGRQAVHRRRRSRHPAGPDADGGDLRARRAARLPRQPRATLARGRAQAASRSGGCCCWSSSWAASTAASSRRPKPPPSRRSTRS